MITWRMEVKDETFTDLRDHPSVGQDYITPDDGVASLDSFSVDGAGNCLEAQFTASPKFVDIRPRDIVSLEVSEDNGSTWTPVYRGYVVTAGNPRSDDIQEYKLVGLRQRFFEITNSMINVPEQDVGNQATYVFERINAASDWPAGVVAAVPTVATVGITNAIVFPQGESYGETLRKIEQAGGRFVVNVGDTYTYDGVTYNEGDTVLGVKFGVDANGNAFFKRPQSNAVTYAEGDDGIVSNYVQITGEEVFDQIDLVYADSIDDNPFDNGLYIKSTSAPQGRVEQQDAVVDPLTRTFSFGTTNARRRVVVQSPTSIMNEATLSVADVSGSGVVNSSGAISGGTTTFGSSQGQVDYSASITDEGFITEFTINPTSTSASLVLRMGIATPLPTLSDFECLRYFSRIGEEFDGVRTLRFVALPIVNDIQSGFADPVNNRPFDRIVPEISFRATNCELSNLKVFEPDVDAGGFKDEQFARAFVRTVQQDVAEVKSVGELGAIADRVNWTPSGESQVTVPVERIEYTLTRRDGLVTTYELGQAYDAEALSQRKVLKDLAREAVSE